MNVVHPINRANRIAWTETCAASDAHPRKFLFCVVDGNEARVVEHLCIFVAPDFDVNVRNNAYAYAFVDRIEGPVWNWTRNLFGADGANDVAIGAEDIESTVKVVTAVSRVKAATYFPDRWRQLRVDVLADRAAITTTAARGFHE